ncbi:MAG: acyl--CoA ligase [Chitinivibrionales bacterium]|nr:acyl--CoA ligase [Chitinivibrionales bacterium]
MEYDEIHTIHQFLESSCDRFGDKVALVHDHSRIRYLELNAMANKVCHYLLDHHIGQGSRILLISENSVAYCACYYATLKAGGVIVPLSTDCTAITLGHIGQELEPAAICCGRKFLPVIEQAVFTKKKDALIIVLDAFSSQPGHLPQKSCAAVAGEGNSAIPEAGSLKTLQETDGVPFVSWEQLMQEERCENAKVCLDETSLASIIYTSGSTGKPKGVMLSHKNIVANTRSICDYLQLTEADIQMVVLPFFYVMGKSLLNTHIAVGGTIVINNNWLYPAAVLNQMVAENVTGFSGVPSTYAYLVYRSPLKLFKEKLKHLRYCSQAGGHMAKQIKLELRKQLPEHTQIYIMYGATEASARLTYLDSRYYEEKIDSIGRPIPGVAVDILDAHGNPVEHGQEGELVASGANIMQGYFNDPALTAQVLDAKGYHTGDYGYRDSDGFIFITGRKDNLLKVSGHRVNTQEVEDGLMATGLVLEAAVVGVPDTLMGNKLVAVVVAQDSKTADAATVLARCSAYLPRFKVPQNIVFVKTLPKKINGKIDMGECRQIVQKQQEKTED